MGATAINPIGYLFNNFFDSFKSFNPVALPSVLQRLKEDLFNFKFPDNKMFNILVLGPRGSGKSSLLNSVVSLFKETVTFPFDMHNKQAFHDSTTYKEDEEITKPQKLRIMDTLCLFDYLDKDLSYFLNGRVENDFTMSNFKNIEAAAKSIDDVSNEERKIHAILLVVSQHALLVQKDLDYISKNLKTITDAGHSPIIVVTHMDESDYSNEEIKQKISEAFGCSPSSVFPHANYIPGGEKNQLIDTSTYNIIREALYTAYNFMKRTSSKRLPSQAL